MFPPNGRVARRLSDLEDLDSCDSLLVAQALAVAGRVLEGEGVWHPLRKRALKKKAFSNAP